MGFYFLFESHDEKINRKVHKEGAKDAKNLSKLLFKIALNYFKKNN